MFETDPLYFRIASYFHSNSYSLSITLPRLFHHLHHFNHRSLLSFDFVHRIKPSTYRAISIISGHQSCYYGANFDDLTLDVYAYRQSNPSFIGHYNNHTRHVYHTHQVNHAKQQFIQLCNYVKQQFDHISNYGKQQPIHISNRCKQ